MSFSQALSGLNAAKSNLGVLGNNIANSQTVGFKGASSQFADVFANSQVGLGTRVSAVLQDFSEGNIEATNRNLDLAISGQGFYRFEQDGEIVYSRNGQLTLTPDGFLQNAQGARIMGYGLNAQGQVQAGGQPQVLTVPADEMPASATTNVATTFNLDSRKVAGEGTSEVTVRNNIEDPDSSETFEYH
ncbi:flagellar hook-basal body complex protein, partial [Halomonas campaniensis]|uniref:flagellar hook-basal body complex protein n=1 Tax=Halomonas campaniensis TaxID=213554 RepID=UPI00397073AD